MIQPEQFRQKAERLYPQMLRAWLDGDETFFPKLIPADRSLDRADHPAAIEAINQLRNGSKEVLGYGYRIEWSRETKSRAFGLNQFPERFFFDSRDDLLRLIHRKAEFHAITRTATRIRAEFGDELDEWMRSHIRLLADVSSELEGLLQVIRYFQDHPRPNVFARELPLPIDTKFVERNQRILWDWLDRLLPPQAIRSDETHFERRFGLHYAEPLILIRPLDPELQTELGLTFSEQALPLHQLARLPVHDVRVFIVENKVNLLTLPAIPRGLALGGLGFGATDLRYVEWLATVPVFYWGDLDVEGFQILSSLRRPFPRIESLLMDNSTLDRWNRFVGLGQGTSPIDPPFLKESELAAFHRCRDQNLRLEQEHVPQAAVEEMIRLIGDSSRYDSSSTREATDAGGPEHSHRQIGASEHG